MKVSTSTAKDLGDFRASLRFGIEEGLSSTAKSISRMGRGCGPYFGQGLRSTFVDLGLIHNVKSLTRRREAEAARTLDRLAYSTPLRMSCKICLCIALLASALWGTSSVMASVRLSGGAFSNSSSASPLKMDPVASLEIQDSVDKLLMSFNSDHDQFLTLSSSLNPQALRFCVATFSSVDPRETPSVTASIPGADSSFRQAKVQFKGRRPLLFMFHKAPGMASAQFIGLRPDIL